MKKEEGLDEMYELCTSKEYRKRFGQFFTPRDIASFMVNWGLNNGVKEILDPAVGTGIFLSEIIKSGKRINNFLGVEIDNNILKIAESRKEMLKMEFDEAKKVKLIEKDFFNLDDKEQFDFIVCNPPYMKFHSYDNKNLVAKIEDKNKIKLSKLTNLYTLFFIHAFSLLKNKGLMAFITPAEFLYTNYGRELKKFLKEMFEIDSIILLDSNKPIFNGAITSAAITLLKKTAPSEEHKVKFVKAKEWNSKDELLGVLGNSTSSRNFSLIEIKQTELKTEDKWLSYFDLETKLNKDKLIRLGEVATVKRGIATGFNEFFTLSEPEVKSRNINEKFIKPVLSKAQHCKGYSLSKSEFKDLARTGEKVFLLYYFENPDEPLMNYVSYGETIGANKRYLTQKRSPWFSMERREPAKILATVFSRDKMRFILNDANVLNLASFHGIYPKIEEQLKIKALLAYLNSNEAKKIISLQKRAYGGGLDKFEPKDLENIYVLDVEKIDKTKIAELSSLFDHLCLAKTKQEEDIAKSKIDVAIREVIDFNLV